MKSLKTTVKRYANRLLEKYTEGKLDLRPTPTVQEYYDEWIKTKRPPMVRESCQRDYKQHFKAYVLPDFAHTRLTSVTTSSLLSFRDKLFTSGISVKTVKNIIASSFRAMWRDAMAEDLVSKNPFALLKWPRTARLRPDPFTLEERDRILEYWREHDPFYYPYIFTQFHTGMRPSEAAALIWADIDLNAGSIAITRSRNLGTDDATKTENSYRILKPVRPEVMRLLAVLPSRDLGLKYVFVNKFARPMTKKWAEHNWAEPLKKLEIRHRKFYSTRHTFITEMVKAGENIAAIAQYCGTSITMIQRDYCGGITLAFGTNCLQNGEKVNENVVAGPGFEPSPHFLTSVELRQKIRGFKLSA